MNTNALQGILWMLLTTLLFVMVTAVVRYIGDAIPAPQAAFIRYVIGTIILPVSYTHLTLPTKA